MLAITPAAITNHISAANADSGSPVLKNGMAQMTATKIRKIDSTIRY
jgi:hypothetical protein